MRRYGSLINIKPSDVMVWLSSYTYVEKKGVKSNQRCVLLLLLLLLHGDRSNKNIMWALLFPSLRQSFSLADSADFCYSYDHFQLLSITWIISKIATAKLRRDFAKYFEAIMYLKLLKYLLN